MSPNKGNQKWKKKSYYLPTEKDWYKQLYTNKMDNIEKMDKFLEM